MGPLNRRRFLLLAAGSAGGMAACERLLLQSRRSESSGGPAVSRNAFALGTQVSITVRHPDQDVACQAINAAFAELALVERLMSIYQPASQLSFLNRTGQLLQPHPYLVEVLRQAQLVAQQTRGAFDITVQPLWEAFAAAAKNQRLPDDATIAGALSIVDWSQLSVTERALHFRLPGMKATLNGIAQGFATDRAVAALQAAGVEHALVDAGELDALGRAERGDTWRVGLQHPRQENAYVALADLDGRALSTSGDYATQFSPNLRHHHILDPRTGYSPTELASVSVLAPTAMLADALSTACFVLGVDASLAWIRSQPGVDAFLVLKDGETICTGGFPLRTAGRAA